METTESLRTRGFTEFSPCFPVHSVSLWLKNQLKGQLKNKTLCRKKFFSTLRKNSRRSLDVPGGFFFFAFNQIGMELKGRHTVKANPATLWTMLMDTDTLAKIVPGISSLEKTGDNSYKSVLEIKMGPVSGAFTGNLDMEDIEEQKGFMLKVQQNSSIGNANAVIKIELIPVNASETEVAFDGGVKVTGLLASMGQRILGSVANMLTKQFFANLERELAPVP